jgi:integrase
VLKRRRVEQAQDRLVMGSGWPGLETVHGDLVFSWPDGTAIHPNVLTRIIGRLSTDAGLPRLTPHGLRHSFASAV